VVAAPQTPEQRVPRAARNSAETRSASEASVAYSIRAWLRLVASSGTQFVDAGQHMWATEGGGAHEPLAQRATPQRATLVVWMASALDPTQSGEVVVPHEKDVQPVTAVRNALLQSSLAEVREHGYFERYSQHIPAAALEELSSNLGPGWVSNELAHAHYGACDGMKLTAEELEGIGESVGQRVRDTSIVVAGSKNPDEAFDLWASIRQLHRVWRRIYQGGSVQITKVGATDQLIHFRGFSLNTYRYFRHANLAAIRSVHEAVGVHVESAKMVRYDSSTQEVTIHLKWT
jgi:hypothetical protein